MILRVGDMDSSVGFYRDLIGLNVLSESPQFTFLDAGSIRLALNAVETVSDDSSLTEVVFESEDLFGDFAAMTARGVPFEVEPRPVMAGEGGALYAAHFRDPDGHLVSVTGWVEEEV